MAPSRQARTAIIPLKADYDKALVKFIKHCHAETNAGVTEEIQERIPVLTEDATAYQTLDFLAAF